MFKKVFSVFVLIIFPGVFFVGNCQTVHKPDELTGIIKKSKLTYNTAELYIDIKEKEYTTLNESLIHNEDSEGHIIVKKTVLNKEAEQEWKTAEAFLRDTNYKEARRHYRNVTDIQADYYPAKIQIGKCWEKEGDDEKAISSYKQAVSKNFVDYQPHLILAKAYAKQKNYDDAINEITMASILNRNDPEIAELMIDYYVSANLKYQDWNFSPQYKIFKGQKDNELKVLSKKGWSGYAIAKAIWNYEPDYAKSQGEKPGEPSLLQEKECMLNLLASLDEKDDKDREESISLLQQAKENKMLDGYIYYEVLLKEKPSLAYQLPNNVLKNIRNYVIAAHGGGKF